MFSAHTHSSGPLAFRSVQLKTVSHTFLIFFLHRRRFQFTLHNSYHRCSIQSIYRYLLQFNQMANPATPTFSFITLLVVSLLVNIAAAAHSPDISPSPSNRIHPRAESPSPSLVPAPVPSVHTPNSAPASSPNGSSPPAQAPANLRPDSTPPPSPSSSPSPADEGDEVNRSDVVDEKSSGGISSGKKAGIAVGVIVAAGAVVLGAIVYKKRRKNIQRSQYSYSGRREFL